MCGANKLRFWAFGFCAVLVSEIRYRFGPCWSEIKGMFCALWSGTGYGFWKKLILFIIIIVIIHIWRRVRFD